MYYKFKRLKADWQFSGWARSWDGIVIEASSGLVAFVNKPINELMTWCQERDVSWTVKEWKL